MPVIQAVPHSVPSYPQPQPAPENEQKSVTIPIDQQPYSGKDMLPLLQKPTNGSKVYTRVDLKRRVVIKGPYTRRKFDLTINNHKKMKSLGDRHTLDIKACGLNIEFPLLKVGAGPVTVSDVEFYDPIAREQKSTKFVERESLGVRQVHKMTPNEIKSLPVSLWVHFAFRYALNIGDSGLYNAISVGEKLYGIDMEEIRGTVDLTSLCGILFSGKPKKIICDTIEQVIASKTEEFLCPLYHAVALASLEDSGSELFIERLNRLITFVVDKF